MRLLKTDTFELIEFVGDEVPKYAILSHTWEGKEVSFRDIQQPDAVTYLKADEPPTPAWAKVKHACQKAQEDEFEFIWIDTCCIDKSSSAELQEAINSMFAWYRNSAICYAFLSDIQRPSGSTGPSSFDITCSRWFTRGWTLQELLAPDFLYFYDASWESLGSRSNWAERISKATTIPVDCLAGPEYGECNEYQDRNGSLIRIPKTRKSIEDELQQATVAARMSWAANRHTTRVEDQAYCLLGLFDIHMPMLYGEGKKAFLRLQQEIIKTSDDATILAWGYGMPPDRDAYMDTAPRYGALDPQIYNQHLREQARRIRPRSLLAASPTDFRFAGALKRHTVSNYPSVSFGITQQGLMLDGKYGAKIAEDIQYLYLPVTNFRGHILALPMHRLDNYDFRTQYHIRRSVSTSFCVPISTGIADPYSFRGVPWGDHQRIKNYLCGSVNDLPSTCVPDFKSRVLALSFRKQPPWPSHEDSDFSLEAVYPAVSRQSFRFVADETELYDDLIPSELEGKMDLLYDIFNHRVFILSITGRRVLLVLETSDRDEHEAIFCHAAILGVEELLEPSITEFHSILNHRSSKVLKVPSLKPRSSTGPPYVIFKLFPGLELWAKWVYS